MGSVVLTNVCKNFQKTAVITDINLEIDNGEFVVFVDPS